MLTKKFEQHFIRIIILNYNESDYTISLIEQLRLQTFTKWEIVVVDNCSTEKERNFLEKNLPPDIIRIFSEENLGYSKGNNLGMKYSGENEIDYFLVLNNDLIFEDCETIEKMLKSIINFKSKNVVASSPLIDTFSTGIALEKQIQTRKILSKWETFLITIPIFKFYTNFKLNGTFLYKKNLPYIGKEMLCDSINGAAFLIEKEFMVSNKYMDEGTFLYYEEIILGRQIKDAGKTCLLNGTTVIKHLQGMSTKSSSNTVNLKMERIKYESSLYYLQKYENIGKLSSYIYIALSEITIVLKKILK